MPLFGKTSDLNDKVLIKNDFFKKVVFAAGLFLGTSSYPGLAVANVKTPGDESFSVLTRQNPAYDPNGIRAGDITFFPSLNTGIAYNDNVYATQVDQMHDLIFTTQPALSIASDFVRHSISASFSAERGLYRDITSENYTDYGASLNGRLDLTGQTTMPINLSYEKLHIRRGSPDDRAGDEPTTYHLMQSTMGLVHSGHTLAMRAIAGFKRYVYDNIETAFSSIDNGDRDYNDYSLYTSIGMAEEAFFAPYVYSNIRRIDYGRDIDNNGYRRDADEYEAGVGSIVNISKVTSGSFNIGYLGRDIEDSRFSKMNALTYGLNLIWQPSTLAAFRLEGKRMIGESTLEDAAGSYDSSLRLSMDYEMFTNVIFTPNLSYSLSEYDGIDKEVKRVGGGLDATYKMNRNMWVTGSYRYTDQSESGNLGNNDEYSNNTYFLSLKLQF
jgi:hypothetical protein